MSDELIPKFQRGDIVRVIADTCMHLYPIGTLLLIMDSRDIRYGPKKSEIRYYVKQGDTYIVEEDIKLLVDIETYTPPRRAINVV